MRRGSRGRGSRPETTRRGFLRLLGAAGGLGMLAACSRIEPSVGVDARVLVVGGGLAGLTCATRLASAGVRVELHEASGRLGGRVRSISGVFSAGRVAESGGEFISSEHRTMRRLVRELGLDLEVVDGGSAAGGADVFWIDGARYRREEADRDWSAVQPRIAAALRSAPWPQRFDASTPAGVELDHRSVVEWIDEQVPGGTSSRLGKLLVTTVVAEYGAEPERQPALNLIDLLGWNPPGSIDPLAGTDERYHVAGGNERVVDGLVRRLPAGTVETGSELVAVTARSGGSLVCTFRRDTAAIDVAADRVVFALPFTTLRRVDLDSAGWSPRKRRAIAELGMADHGKLHVEVSRRPWLDLGLGGAVVTEADGFQECWDETAAAKGEGGIVVDLRDHRSWEEWPAPPFGAAPAAIVSEFLDRLDPVFPGVAAAAGGRTRWDRWGAHRWSLGSYSRYELGQITAFGGIEGRAEGAAHFCGEHTSSEFQGYMEGAARSGERAAREVLGALR